ncbi:MAG: MarR family winged helix-turn-helix transcriptional regulator [Bacteriovoracaceae bacterium]
MAKKIRIEDALCFGLYTTSRLMTQVYGPYLKTVGLTYPQFLVMNLLWEKDHLNLKDIGERLYLDSGTLTPLIKRLVDQKLILKKRFKSDERAIEISLTKKGKDLELKCADIPMQMFCKLNVSTEQFLEIHRGVNLIMKNLLSHC